jgi:hypothetical protein
MDETNGHFSLRRPTVNDHAATENNSEAAAHDMRSEAIR